MGLSNSKKRRQKKSFIFRGKSTKSRNKQLLEAVIMLIAGINLIFFLNTLPSDFFAARISKDIWIELYKSIIYSFYLLGGIGVALIVVSLLIISLILLVGGVIRLILYYRKRKVKNK